MQCCSDSSMKTMESKLLHEEASESDNTAARTSVSQSEYGLIDALANSADAETTSCQIPASTRKK